MKIGTSWWRSSLWAILYMFTQTRGAPLTQTYLVSLRELMHSYPVYPLHRKNSKGEGSGWVSGPAVPSPGSHPGIRSAHAHIVSLSHLRPMKFRDDRARPSDQKQDALNYTKNEQLRGLFFVATPHPRPESEGRSWERSCVWWRRFFPPFALRNLKPEKLFLTCRIFK